jgi:hypothetical protein
VDQVVVQSAARHAPRGNGSRSFWSGLRQCGHHVARMPNEGAGQGSGSCGAEWRAAQIGGWTGARHLAGVRVQRDVRW